MWLLSPLSWLLLACCLALAGWAHARRKRLLLGSALLLACGAILAMTPLFANTLVGWLESERPMPDDCRTSPPPIAVVLAGGIDGRPQADDDYSVLTLASRRRVELAVAWWHARPGRRLVFAGGPANRGVPESHVMAGYARQLGVPQEAMRTEDTSKTTWDNARNLARLQPALPQRITLLTSALHLPRATYAMRQAGFEVCAIGTDSRFIPMELPGYLIPQTSAMSKTEDGLHEVVGLIYYHWLQLRAKPRASRPDQAAFDVLHRQGGRKRITA